MFQKTIISKYLKNQNAKHVAQRWDLFKAHFHHPEIQTNIRQSKEEQYQGEFLLDLFVHILGYTKNPAPNFNLTTEYKNVKDSKKADGAIFINNSVTAIIELKGTKTTDLSKIEEQAFGYKNNQPDCKYIITSNFEKLRLYIDNAIEHLEFNLFELTFEQFQLLYLCLACENILANIPEKMKAESLSQEDVITTKLYKDYSVFKRELFTNLTFLNPDFEPLELFKKSQKLLDRFLFLFFGEDRGLLPPNSVRLILEDWTAIKDRDEDIKLYDRFKKYFGYLNVGFKGKRYDVFAYNGGLFKTDEILDAIKIDDELLYKHTLKLADYDFDSEVDVNILGHIFENSLNELDEVKAQLEGQEIDKSKTKRKKDGVFYTPKYITKYIVENTVGKLCDNKKIEFAIVEEDYFTDKKRQQKTKLVLLKKLDDYRAWLHEITIIDPACGSGAFLNEALNFLIEEHQYIDELEAKLTGSSIAFTYHSESILENNLFGVDLNEESVEIAKLSLWLRTAEPNRKLNSLNDNIKCGNSLIDDPEVAGDKAFNWEKEFPQIFAKGGFDVVIGNPPYVSRSLNEGMKMFLNLNFKTAQYQVELYVAFMEKAINICKVNGNICFIVPNSWLKNLMMSECRKFMIENLKFISIIPNLENVFTEASVDTMIFIGKNNTSNLENEILIDEFINQNLQTKHKVKQARFLTNKNYLFDVEVNDAILPILNKINTDVISIGEIFDVTRGVNPYDRNTGQSAETISTRAYHSDRKQDETFVPELKGMHASRYSYNWDGNHYISYGKWLAAPRQKKYFEGKRIIFREILGKTLVSTLIEEKFVIDRSLYIAKLEESMIEKFRITFVLGILNSKLLAFFFRYSNNEFDNLFPKIRVAEFKNLPIKSIDFEDQEYFAEKVEEILSFSKYLQETSAKFRRTCERKFENLSLNKKLQDWYKLSYADFVKELIKQKIKLTLSEEAEWADYFDQEKSKALEIQSEIVSTDKEIDKMVYELYGLTEEEIRIIENS